MDVMKYLSCFVCLVMLYGPEFSEAQGMFGRSLYPRGGRLLRRPLYPRYPIGYPRVDPYPRRIVYPERDIYDPAILPVVGRVGLGARRPIVSDQSDTRRQSINVSNNNNNVREEHGSGNVNVNQVTNTGGGRNCECRVDPFMMGPGQCGPYRQCVEDSSCTGGGNNGVCREAGFLGGHGGMMI